MADESRLSFNTAELCGVTLPLPPFPSAFPAEKRIPGTRFIVDGFRFAGPWSTAYFLSHFHSDHYTGLTPLWDKGPIFCSEITARLLIEFLKLPVNFVFPLALGEKSRIDLCDVILVDANHCPGAVQMLFQVPADNQSHRRFIHTGDMRFSPAMKADSALCDFVGADAVFLDTTYCNPKFVFPSQDESISYVAETIFKLMQAEEKGSGCDAGKDDAVSNESVEEKAGFEDEDVPTSGPSCAEEDTENEGGCYDMKTFAGACIDTGQKREEFLGESNQSTKKGPTLFLISTYVVGKEKILLSVAKRCNCLIYVDQRKLSIVKCLDLHDIGVFTTDPLSTNVHVVGWNLLGDTWPFFRPNFQNLQKFLKDGYSRIVGFVPTGWTYEIKKTPFSLRRKGFCEIHLVPYSEHSSYGELREYVGFIRPKEIIPTVGLEGSGVDGKAVTSMRKHFRNLVDETASKRKFLKGFKRKAACELAGDTDFAAESRLPRNTLLRAKIQLNEESSTENVSEAGLLQGNSTQRLSCSLAENMSIPKAVFGRTARKRKRESCGMYGANMQLDSPYDGSQNVYDAIQMHAPSVEKPEETSEKNINDNASRTLTGLCHESPCSGNPEQSDNNVTASDGEREIQLKSFLPTWVSSKQVKNLLLQENWDVDAAVSRFYDEEESFQRESSNVTSSEVLACTVERKECSLIEHVTGSEVGRTSLINNDKDDILAEVGSQKLDSTYQTCKGASPISSSKSIIQGHGSSISGSRDQLKTPGTTSRKKGTSMQPSILSFFKKNDPNVKTWLGLKDTCELLANSQNKTSYATSVTASHGKTSNMESSSEKLHQLLLILDGRLSEQDATTLLEEGGGDVNAALDLFYMRGAESKDVADSEDAQCSFGGKSLTCEDGKAKEATLDSQAVAGNLDVVTCFSNCRDASKLEGFAYSVVLPLEGYIPIEHACWSIGEPAPYLHLARSFDMVERESGRLKTTDILCNMFRSLLALSPDDVLPAVYLATNHIAPDHENLELNIGGSMVAAAIVEASGTHRSKLKEMYNIMGDLGDVAQTFRRTQGMLIVPRPLSIRQVFSTLHQISKEAGSGSSARKKSLILGLLRACREKETKYIVRTLVRNMRIGAMMRTILPALAQAVVLHCADHNRSERVDKIKTQFQNASTAIIEAYNFLPNLNVLVPSLIQNGINAVLEGVKVSIGTPVKPMLAKIANGIPELLKRFHWKSFTCEYKYDGVRAQIHRKKDGSVSIFSRNCEDSTSRFPDVADIVCMAAKSCAREFILDAEIVAVDRENNNKLMAFQHLSTRERGSHDGNTIKLENIKVDVCLFAFDLMYSDGDLLVKLPLRERRKRLHNVFSGCIAGRFGFATEVSVEAKDADLECTATLYKLETFLEESFSASCEGLIAKELDEDSGYAASKRSDSWLKVKRDYIKGLHDTLDLVPIGAWHGNGRKAGWYSPFLLACYDSDHEEYQSVCRVMSGFSDAFYKKMKEFFSGDRILACKPPYYRTLEDPDVWFSAEVVWEICGADFTISPVHQAAAGLVHPSRGISMRFPRFVRERPDKKPENASSPSDIADLFNHQTRKFDILYDNGQRT